MDVDALQAQKETLLNQLNSLSKLMNKVTKGKQDRLSYAQNKNVSISIILPMCIISMLNMY